MSDLSPPCENNIYENGSVVLMCAGASKIIEEIVVEARTKQDVSIDWHYVAGRAMIKTLDNDIVKIRTVFMQTAEHLGYMNQLQFLQTAEHLDYLKQLQF